MTVRVRAATPDDVDGIARVHVEAWRETYRDLVPADLLAGLSVADRAATWRRAFERPDPRSVLLVAEEGGAVAGFARAGPTRDALLATDAEIYAIYLLDRVKRRGVGRRLMAAVLAHLAGAGLASAGLWVLRDNAPARRFYEALGAAPGPEKAVSLLGRHPAVELAYRFALDRPPAPGGGGSTLR